MGRRLGRQTGALAGEYVREPVGADNGGRHVPGRRLGRRYIGHGGHGLGVVPEQVRRARGDPVRSPTTSIPVCCAAGPGTTIRTSRAQPTASGTTRTTGTTTSVFGWCVRPHLRALITESAAQAAQSGAQRRLEFFWRPPYRASTARRCSAGRTASVSRTWRRKPQLSAWPTWLIQPWMLASSSA